MFRRFLSIGAVALTVWGCGAREIEPATERTPSTPGIATALERGIDPVFEKAVVGPQEDGTYIVATTQRIDPAGETVAFSGRPVDLALSPDGTVLAVKNRNDLVFLDAKTRAILQRLRIPNGGSTWTGIQWSKDGSRVWTTDTRGHLRSARRTANGEYEWADDIFLPPFDGRGSSGPGGFALDEADDRAYVAISRNNALGIVDLAVGELIAQIDVGIAPYAVVQLGRKVYVTNWGGRRPVEGDVTGPTSGSRAVVDPETGVASSGTVSVVDLDAGETVKEIAVDLHPSGMVLSPDGAHLFVANANSDTVSVIDTATDEVIATLDPKPMPELPFGSAPNALAISPDGRTLYVANGGNNALAVLDLTTRSLAGLIPTGWYPGAVVLSHDGSMLYVANTKGVGSRDKRREKGYNSHDYLGTVSFVPVPDAATLEAYTIRAAANMRLPRMNEVMNLRAVEERTVPVPTRPGEVSPIKHVLYIIKENRTYDQVLGDLPQGNGDPELTIFGRKVTPNHHALAEEFVLLDNFYCNGTLSADGHQWTDEGYVTDYIEKAYGGYVRSYPYDGDDALAYASSGFIWDNVLRAGLTLRVYGEFVQAQIEPRNATWLDAWNDYKNGTQNVTFRATTLLHTLEPYLSPNFIGFPSKILDVQRAQVFIEELKGYEEKGGLPNFMIMLLPNDHTVGTRPNYPTPRAAVADNDLALGKIVEAVSHSKFWPETAIFVVQDDPQAGFDHVDGRRTVAFVISPYTKRGEVVSVHYNQSSMLRTIELILGLPPMNQFDMAANPMVEVFTETPDFTPYTARPNEIPLDELNPEVSELEGMERYYAELSLSLPLDDIDQADEDTLNRILWHSVKGIETPYPRLADAVDPITGARGWTARPSNSASTSER